jgi:hypothetical protein
VLAFVRRAGFGEIVAVASVNRRTHSHPYGDPESASWTATTNVPADGEVAGQWPIEVYRSRTGKRQRLRVEETRRRLLGFEFEAQ